MKFTIGVLLGIILGAFIIGIMAFLLFSNLFSDNQIATTVPNTTAHQTTIASPTPTINVSPSPTANVLPSPSATVSETLDAEINTSSGAQDVNFNLSLTSYNISGVTSGTVEASITNTGSTDAHNARIKVELSSRGSSIKIGNQDYFQKDLGIIAAGTTLDAEATLTVNAMDGLKIFTYGAIIKLTIISDEKIQDMTFEIPPQV